MSLTIYKEQFDTAYQTIFQKALVAMEIANSRFEKNLSFGASVKRVKLYINGIRVRDISIGVNRTIDSVYDSGETLTVNNNKGTTFRISNRELVQSGPLNPSETLGAKTAMKTAIFVDGDVLAEIRNAQQTFDTGDLTTSASNGTPITLSATTVPQMFAQAKAKLGVVLGSAANVLGNLAVVVDSYGLSQIEQYLLSKNIDVAEAVFRNGYTGETVGGAELYISENLPTDAKIALNTNPSNGNTITINGFTFTFVTAIGTTAGNVLIGASADATRTNLVALLNAPDTTTANGVALADVPGSFTFALSDFFDARLAATNNGVDSVLLTGKGSGRIKVSSNVAGFALTYSLVHYYYGKKGAIDVVIQDEVDADIKDDPYQRAKIVMSDKLYGIKSFADGKIQMLDVQVAA